MKWVSCSDRLPPANAVVMTKVHDGKGKRCERYLLFFQKDAGSPATFIDPDNAEAVQYAPTHWRLDREAKVRPSVEQRLYEAFMNEVGVKLSYEDLVDLLASDESIQARIAKKAAKEAGIELPGGNHWIGATEWGVFKLKLKERLQG